MLYTLPLRGRAVAITASSPLDLGAEVMYAAIENGRVTAVAFGVLPASDDTTYYVDLSTYDVLPAVDWYFSDICQTFSATAPVIPAGESAPPYTPGTTPPTPGDPNYPDPELPPTDDPVPLASTAPFWVSFHADGVASVSIAGGADLTEVDSRMRTTVRMNDICAVRLQAEVLTADAALSLFLCFSTDGGTTWEELSVGKTGPTVSLGALGNAVGLFLNVDPAVAGDTLLSICTKGSGSAVVGNILACFYVKTTDGVCVEIVEGGCTPPADYPIYAEDFSNYASWADFGTARYYSSDPDYWNLFSDLGLIDPVTPSFWEDFDSTIVLPGLAQSLVARIQDDGGALYYGIPWITLFEALSNDVTVQWVGRITPDAGNTFATTYNTVPLGDVTIGSPGAESQFGPGYGLIMLSIEDKAPPAEGGGRTFHDIAIRSGRVYYEPRQGSFYGLGVTDIGDAADFFTSTDIQITVRCDYLNGTDARIRIYVDAACPDNPASPTLWATINPGGNRQSTNSQWRTMTMFNYGGTADPPDAPAYAQINTHNYSYNNDFSLYGLT